MERQHSQSSGGGQGGNTKLERKSEGGGPLVDDS